MPILTSHGYVSRGFRVDRRGRYNKWESCGIYCDREAAETAIRNVHGNDGRGKTLDCRIVEVEV